MVSDLRARLCALRSAWSALECSRSRGTGSALSAGGLESVGPNARLVRDRAAVERTVRQLKAETNGQIEVNGAGLAASLIRLGLVDEFRLYMMWPTIGSPPYSLQPDTSRKLGLLGLSVQAGICAASERRYVCPTHGLGHRAHCKTKSG